METVNQGNEEKVFTQEEVDQIVEGRLARERKRYGDMSDYEELKEKALKFDQMEEAAKTELQKATERATALEAEVNSLRAAEQLRSIREKVASETGVPVSLLTADTEEACQEQAQAVLTFAKPAGYPQVKDGGEITHKGKQTAQDSFSEWFRSVQK